MKLYRTLIVIAITSNIQSEVKSIRTQEEFDSDIIQTGKPAVVKFYADWCGPCQTAQEPFYTISNQSEFKEITFGQVNADKAPQLITSYEVTGLPTFLFFDKQGNQVLKKTGLLGAADAQEFTRILTNTLTQVFKTDSTDYQKQETKKFQTQDTGIWSSISNLINGIYQWIKNLF